ncbi:TOBE domain protein [compost metagenome]
MLNGQIEDLTYLGTDTHIRVRLPDTSLFTIRQQNNRVGPIGFSAGDPVSLNISEGAAQILKD